MVQACLHLMLLVQQVSWNLYLTNLIFKTDKHLYDFTAILISGLKANNIETCPYFIKRAMENSALYQNKIDHFSQGHGLLQVK